MTVNDLIKFLEQAPNKEAKVFFTVADRYGEDYHTFDDCELEVSNRVTASEGIPLGSVILSPTGRMI